MFTDNLISQMNQLQNQQNQLQNQVTTGLKVSLPEDDPATMNQVLTLQSQAASNTQYQSNITELQSAATTSADAMNSLQTITEQAGEIATEAAGGVTSSSQLSTYATQVGSLIQEALQAANTKDANGNYIFGGTINNQPPFSAATDSNGDVTAVAYNGNTDVSDSQIGPGQTASAQVPGANTTGTGPAGLLADSRSGADLFSHLISLQQNLISGSTTAISSTDSPNLTTDENNIVSNIASNGVLQSTLETANTAATQLGTNITTQTSNLTSVDLTTAMTQLDQVQTAYQATMESGSMIMPALHLGLPQIAPFTTPGLWQGSAAALNRRRLLHWSGSTPFFSCQFQSGPQAGARNQSDRTIRILPRHHWQVAGVLGGKSLEYGKQVFVRIRRRPIGRHQLPHPRDPAVCLGRMADRQKGNPSAQLVLIHHRQAGQAVISHQAQRFPGRRVRVDAHRQVNHHVRRPDPPQRNRLELLGMVRRLQTAVDLGGEDRSLPRQDKRRHHREHRRRQQPIAARHL